MRVLPLLSIVLACACGFARAQSPLSKPLSELAIYPQRSAPATALSVNNTTISAQLMATVSRIKVQVSQQVQRGEQLLQLDCADYQLNRELAEARLEAAQAQSRLAQSELERNRQLLASALTSQQQVDSRLAEQVSQQALLKQRQVEVRQAELNVQRCTLIAPFDGVVTARLVSEGQLANVGTGLISLVDTTNLELSASVSYEDALQFPQVDSFVFDYGKQLSVSIQQMGGVIDSLNRSREIRLVFGAEKPLPGTAGKLLWRDPRPFVPSRLIVTRQSQLGVFVEDGGRAKFVVLEQASPGRPAVTRLPLDTWLVIEGLALLQDGQVLKVQ